MIEQIQISSPSATRKHLAALDRAGRKVSSRDFQILSGKSELKLWDTVEAENGNITLVKHQAPIAKPHNIKEYFTQKPIATQMLELFTQYRVVRRDFAKWWPTQGNEPFVGEVRGCPNMRGIMLATNGIDGFVGNGVDYGFFCHLANFIVDIRDEDDVSTNMDPVLDRPLSKRQGELNRMVMPFGMWLKQSEMQRILARESELRKENKARDEASGVAVTRQRVRKFTLDRAQLLSMFQ